MPTETALRYVATPARRYTRFHSMQVVPGWLFLTAQVVVAGTPLLSNRYTQNTHTLQA